MRLSRLVPVAVASVLLVVTVSPASAATPGVGTTTGELSVLDLDLGDLLQVGVLADSGLATTDADAPSASAVLSALSVVSGPLGLDEQLDVFSVESTGEEDTVEGPAEPIDTPVLSGSLLPATLRALVGDGGAVSTLGAGIADLSVLNGVLDLQSTELALDNTAATEDAAARRGFALDGLTALDLTSLLAGLGVPVTELPLEDLLGVVDGLGLLDQLGIDLADLGVPLDLENLDPTSLTTTLTDLSALLGLDTTALQALCDATDPILDLIPDELVADPCADLAATLDTQAALGTLLQSALDTVLGVLDGVTLITLNGLDVGVVTSATDSLETSVADVTATLGGLTVGSLDLGSLDVLGASESVLGAVEQANTTLDSLLAPLGLDGLVDIGLLEQDASVTEKGDTIDAIAEFTGLRVTLAPLSDLPDVGDLLGSLGGGSSIAGLFDTLGVAVPIDPLTELAGTIGGDGDPIGVLSQGGTIRVASLAQASSFRPVAAPAPAAPQAPAQPSLPKTGSNDTLGILLGAAAVAGALSLRLVLRSKR